MLLSGARHENHTFWAGTNVRPAGCRTFEADPTHTSPPVLCGERASHSPSGPEVSGLPSGAEWSNLVARGPHTQRSQTETAPLLMYFVSPHSVL